ncbi:MAG: ABC transporter permease [Ilumatobacteraceae bacterium]|nr:ABC transporter permease [Ilumatobacteraceae bacterium]
MNGNIWVLASADSVAIATTLVLAALGALFTERAGVLNLGIEGILLTAAISSFLAADSSGSIWLGLIVGSLVGALLAGIHAVLSVVLRANQIVAGLALVIFGTGLANFLGKPAEGKTVATIIKPLSFGPLSDIPLVGPIVFRQDPITYASIVIAILASLYLFRSRPGLELRATGDDPATVDAQGLSVASIRIRYTLFGGLLVGLGGSWLMLAQSAAWHQAATTNGIGWIALALVVFAGWRPMRLIFGAILFGFTLQLPFTLQAEQITFIPSALMQMLPYLATLIALIGLSRPSTRNKLGAPKALGIPFVRDER